MQEHETPCLNSDIDKCTVEFSSFVIIIDINVDLEDRDAGSDQICIKIIIITIVMGDRM